MAGPRVAVIGTGGTISSVGRHGLDLGRRLVDQEHGALRGGGGAVRVGAAGQAQAAPAGAGDHRLRRARGVQL